MLALVLLFAAPAAHAADVTVSVSSRETSVGLPVELKVEIENAEEFDPPEIPEIEGATVEPVPGQSRQEFTQIINGRVTRTVTVTLTFRIVPKAPGTLTIPPISVRADGKLHSSRPIDIAVVKSDSGDLLFVEVTSDRESIYLGESLDLTLQIWIKPYRDSTYSVRLNEREMWSRVDDQLCEWGEFAETLAQWAAERRRPRGREVLRDLENGERGSYFLYEIPVKIWPEQAGPLDPGEVAVTVIYPTRLGRNRSFFNEELRIVDTRPVRVTAAPPPVLVKTPPQDGRPPGFSGAVGQFGVELSATPTDVAVGDPITVVLSVTDLTADGTRLDLLQPPPLLEIKPLTERFRLPSDPLAGEVEGRTKRFTQTIRAVDEHVDQIPAIPFVYFDPKQEAYETVATEPIEIAVRAASTVALSDVVSAAQVAPGGPKELTLVTGGLLANVVEPQLLLRQARFEPQWWMAAMLAAPPLLFLVTAVTQRRVRRLRGDVGFARQRRAGSRARQRLAAARRAGSDEQPEKIGAAVIGFVADRCNLPAGAETATDVLAVLRKQGVRAELVGEVQTLLYECEHHRYAGGSGGGSNDLLGRSEACIKRLERERL